MTARKVAAGLFVSLDGVVEAPETWHFPYLNEEMGAAIGWANAALIEGDVIAAVKELKQQPGGTITLAGSPTGVLDLTYRPV